MVVRDSLVFVPHPTPPTLSAYYCRPQVSRPVVGSMVVRDRLADNPFFKLGGLG